MEVQSHNPGYVSTEITGAAMHNGELFVRLEKRGQNQPSETVIFSYTQLTPQNKAIFTDIVNKNIFDSLDSMKKSMGEIRESVNEITKLCQHPLLSKSEEQQKWKIATFCSWIFRGIKSVFHFSGT